MISSHLTSPSKLFFSTFFLETALAQLPNESLGDNNQDIRKIFHHNNKCDKCTNLITEVLCVSTGSPGRMVGVSINQAQQRPQVANSKRLLLCVEPACVEMTQFLKMVFSLGMRGKLHYFKIFT